MASPCGGCPPCCTRCVFDKDGVKASGTLDTIVSKEDYGCVLPNGGAIVKHEGVLGMMRGENFHPVSVAGADFLRSTNNPLAVHV